MILQQRLLEEVVITFFIFLSPIFFTQSCQKLELGFQWLAWQCPEAEVYSYLGYNDNSYGASPGLLHSRVRPQSGPIKYCK